MGFVGEKTLGRFSSYLLTNPPFLGTLFLAPSRIQAGRTGGAAGKCRHRQEDVLVCLLYVVMCFPVMLYHVLLLCIIIIVVSFVFVGPAAGGSQVGGLLQAGPSRSGQAPKPRPGVTSLCWWAPLQVLYHIVYYRLTRLTRYTCVYIYIYI